MSHAPRPQRRSPSSSPPHGSSPDDVVAPRQRREAVDRHAERREVAGHRVLAGRLGRDRERPRLALGDQLRVLARMRDQLPHEPDELVPPLADRRAHRLRGRHGRRS
jgi:hypothetical protein